jgi:hypothetical protein
LYVLCDVDNTISDARWRDHLIGQWDEYYMAGEHDHPVTPMIRLVNSLSLLSARVIHLTGRPEQWRGLTLSWMVRHKVLSHGLLMRPEGDYRPQRELKPALAMEQPWWPQVRLVVDDREDVLEAFRALGVHTLRAGLGGPVETPEEAR